MNLEKRWRKLTQQFDIEASISDKMYNEISEKYSESHRHYHNLEHLQELFTWSDKYTDLTEEKVVLELAIWYHDIIYSVWFPGKNEVKSADFAVLHTRDFDLSEAQKLRLYSWIESTKKHILPPAHDTLTGRLFMDFDMAILAASREKYLVYCGNIRKEYSVYPDLIYNAGRKKALQSFLEVDKLFLSSIFREEYEVRARENLLFELEELR